MLKDIVANAGAAAIPLPRAPVLKAADKPPKSGS
jgi:hypothetical protein